jgi:hypothetical protein
MRTHLLTLCPPLNRPRQNSAPVGPQRTACPGQSSPWISPSPAQPPQAGLVLDAGARRQAPKTSEDREVSHRPIDRRLGGLVVRRGGRAAGAFTSTLSAEESKAVRDRYAIIGGEKDHIMPPSVNRSNTKALRDHWTCGAAGREAVADYALDWPGPT